jgi:hypothetical protein
LAVQTNVCARPIWSLQDIFEVATRIGAVRPGGLDLVHVPSLGHFPVRAIRLFMFGESNKCEIDQ